MNLEGSFPSVWLSDPPSSHRSTHPLQTSLLRFAQRTKYRGGAGWYHADQGRELVSRPDTRLLYNQFRRLNSQDSLNPAIPWLTSATLTHNRISVIVKLNFRTSIVLTRRTPTQLDAIANGKKIRVVFS